MKNFAIAGVAGYVAPKHLRAIRETGNTLVAAFDPRDAVGMIDQFSYDVSFFTEFERFDRHLEKLKRGPEENRVDYLSVCSPNFLHDAHCRLAMRVGADAICEKPMVVSPWNLDHLQEMEQETGRRVYNILQLRLHPKLLELRRSLLESPSSRQANVTLTYVTARGKWYDVSWKGDQSKSGGVAMNIGIHFFDMLQWLFGEVEECRVYCSEARRMGGFLNMQRAKVKWFLSVNANDLPFQVQPGVRSTYRSITIDGEEVEFTQGFTDLHTKSYEEILAGRGFGVNEAKDAVNLAYRIRTSLVASPDDMTHPFITKD